MPRYRVIIHGRNLRLPVEGRVEALGFYTPRWINAPDPAQAVQLALAEFRQSEKFRSLIAEVLNSDDDLPVLSGESVEEAEPGTGDAQRPAGLALYRVDNLNPEPSTPPDHRAPD